MATVYGETKGASLNTGWRSVLVYTLTDNGTSVTINTTLKIQTGGQYSIWSTNIKGTTTIGTGSGASTSKTITDADSGTQTTLVTKSRTYTKTGADQSITLTGAVVVSNSTSTASVTVTIPKLTYAVKYNANGGDTSSIPAAQTKIYDTTLTLSNKVPTRAGCTFLGWNTKSDGSGTNYAAGGSYTENAALTLYAIWLGISVPTITATRTDATGTDADEGTYGTVAASWQAVGTIAATVAVTAKNATAGTSITLSGNTSGSKAAGKTASGNVSALFGGSLSSDKQYKITVTATLTYTYNDATKTLTATATAYVTYAYITLEGYSGGHGLAVGIAAHREGFDMQMDPFYAAVPAKHNTDISTSAIANVIVADTSVASVTGVAARTWGKVCMLTINWTNVNEISVPASGNIANLVIGTLVEGLRPAISCAAISHGDNAGQCFYSVSSGGGIQLGAVEGTGSARTIAAGTTFNLHAVYIIP